MPIETSRANNLEWLRSRKKDLISQLAVVDAQLAPLVGGPGPNHNGGNNVNKISSHAVLPTNSDGTRGGVRGGGASSAGGWQQQQQQQHQPSREDFGVGGRNGGAGAEGAGVDAEGHFILGLSTEAFGSTPVDEVTVALWFPSFVVIREGMDCIQPLPTPIPP